MKKIMKHIFPILILTLSFAASAQAAPFWRHDDSNHHRRELSDADRRELEAERAHETDEKNEIDTYSRNFDALHSAVGTIMLECKTAVSLWQVSAIAGDSIPALPGGSSADITSCIQKGQDEVMRRYNEMLATPSDVSSFSLPALNRFIETVQQVFADFVPRKQTGKMEGMEAYDRRFTQMQEEIDATADLVLQRIRIMNQ
jgi:hypothetical protein